MSSARTGCASFHCQVFAPGTDGRAVAHAPISCFAELEEYGYRPLVHGQWT